MVLDNSIILGFDGGEHFVHVSAEGRDQPQDRKEHDAENQHRPGDKEVEPPGTILPHHIELASKICPKRFHER